MMNKNRNRLYRAIAVALSSSSLMAPQVLAQEPGPSEEINLEEVLVTGVRGSLQRALDIKRESSGVVDAISAEDIGKFPDTNLAESLQRITGVSINRVQGEGSEVTVRGFSGDFNRVTLNGRQVPAANIGGAESLDTVGDSRSFDFSNLSSEGVIGLQVYKTAQADVPSGGIGATINMQTLRPLAAGKRLTFGAKGVHDTGPDEVEPEFSGLGSWVNDSGTFGVSAFGAFQRRESSERLADPGGSGSGFVWQVPFDPNNATFRNAEIINQPGPDDLAGFQKTSIIRFSEQTRERINGMVTFEFEPSERLNITVDGMYAENEIDQFRRQDGAWLSRQFTFAEFNGNPTVSTLDLVAEPITQNVNINEGLTEAGKDLTRQSFDVATRDDLWQAGINVDFEINDSLTVNFDASRAIAESGGNLPGGFSNRRLQIGCACTGFQAIDFSGDLPEALEAISDGAGPSSTTIIDDDGTERTVNFAGANGNGIIEKGDISSATIRTDKTDQTNELNQFKVDLNFDNGGPVRAKFGASYRETEMRQTAEFRSNDLGGNGLAFTGDVLAIAGEDALRPEVLVDKFEDKNFRTADQLVSDFSDAGVPIPEGASFVINGGRHFTVDPTEVAKAFDGFVDGGGNRFDFDDQTIVGQDNNLIEEEVLALFGQAVLESEIAGRPMRVRLGLRWEDTDVTSQTQQLVPQTMRWVSDNDFILDFNDTEQVISEGFSYTNTLPNLDFSVDVAENLFTANDTLKARFSVGRTLARPEFSDMFLKTDTSQLDTLTFLGGTGNASRGTAKLDPLESDNVDISLEYYYGEGSAFTVAFFDKNISNFVGNRQIRSPVFGLRDATSGEPGTRSGDAIAALEARGVPANEQNIFTMTAILDNPDAFPNGADAFIPPSEQGGADQAFEVFTEFDVVPNENDPLIQWVLQEPTNQASANIDGWELSWQHFFSGPLQGFGFLANATFVSGDVGIDLTANPNMGDQFALTGLSDSSNIVVFYENQRFGARVALNKREEFLSDTNISDRVPRFFDNFTQLDFNLSYNITDKLQATLEGINMTEEDVTAHGRTSQDTQFFIEGDRRFLFGMRYNFFGS